LVNKINKAENINKEQYMLMSKKARMFANEHFDPDKHYNKLINIYNQAILSHENN